MYLWHAANRADTTRAPRERLALVAGAAVLAAAALSAATASMQIDFDPPAALEAGREWQASLEVKRGGLPVDDVQPLVAVTDGSGITHFFSARHDRAGRYRVKLLLPQGGTWTYEVLVGSRVYERGAVRAKPALQP